MIIKLKDAKGKTFSIDTTDVDSIKKLRAAAREKFAIADDTSSIKLIYHGKLLADEKTLESYEIKEEAVIMVIATKKSTEQLQNEKDYLDHKEVKSS